MLVLTRRPGQALYIGDSIEVYVAEVRGDQVRLSIRAPRNIPVLRGEVIDAVTEENREAAAIQPDLLDQLAGLTTACTDNSEKKPQKTLKPSLVGVDE